MRANNEKTATLQDFVSASEISSPVEQACMARIAELQALSFKGLLGLTLFMLMSVGAFFSIDYQWSIPAHVLEVLGASPPVYMISLALAVYCFSAVLLVLPKIVDGSDRYRGWSALGFLGAFYIFYFYAGALEINFWAVFAAGALVLSLEYVGLLIFSRKETRKETEVLERYRRMAR